MITLDYYGIEGTGKTLTAAKADAGAKIRTMLEGTYSPQVVTYRGYAVLVFREPRGWATRVIADGEDGIYGTGTGGGCFGYADQFEAMKAARMHVAQLSWLESDGLLPPNFLPEYEAREFISWARFQLEYKRLRAAGVPESDCHRQACEAMYV